MGRKRIFRRHCRASEMGPDKRDGSPPHLVPSPFPLPPPAVPLARRSERRKEVATLTRIFPKKSENEARNGKRKAQHIFSPFPLLLSPRFTRLAYSSRSTCATRGDMQNDHLSTPLLIADPMQIRAYCAFNGPCATRYARGEGYTDFNCCRGKERTLRTRIYVHGVDDKSGHRRVNHGFSRAVDCIHFRIITSVLAIDAR